MSVTTLLAISLGAILTNNFIFSQFLGICPFLGVSKKIDTAVGNVAVEQHNGQAPRGRGDRLVVASAGVDDQAVHAGIDKSGERLGLLGGIVAANGRHERAAARGGTGGKALEHSAGERVGDVGQDHADEVGARAAQIARGSTWTIAAGSERLCLLTEASDDSPVRRKRAEAFTDELLHRGLAGEVVTLADGGATGVGRLDETIRGYAGKKLGLIAVNGLVFLRLTEALAQLGPSLPAGLKIATFDDYPWNHVLFGGVTTAAQDTLTIAERVVERLSERIDVVTTTVGEAAKLAPKRIEIPGHIEHRASTSR